MLHNVEQGKPSALTYPIAGADNLSPNGAVIPFVDGHQRQLPRLTAGPFRYRTYAQQYLPAAQKYASVPVKQAVVAPSAMSLLYPPEGIADYSREEFVQDLLTEAEADIRGCLDNGAHIVQLDFEEGRLSLKLDPSGGLLREFMRPCSPRSAPGWKAPPWPRNNWRSASRRQRTLA